ncbi:MAG: Tfp pilus assembly protein FimT/FimU [Chthoniobacteraceae bacterium]
MHAFSLLELIVVMGIAVGIMTLVGPAVTNIKGGEDLASSAYMIKGALEEARTYAVVNHTYTWVGVFEEDLTKADATPAQSGVGRLAIAIVASKDGTSIYSKTVASSSNPSVQVIPPSRLIQIGKVIKLNNVHVVDATARKVGVRLAGVVKQSDLVGLSSDPLLFSFQYPLRGTAKYTFGINPSPVSQGESVPSGVVQFSPQGEALSESGPMISPAACREIAIQATRGTTLVNSQNVVAIDVSGLTGQVTIYRP